MSDLAASELHLRLALKAARQGAWEFDLATGQGYRSPELRQLLGVGNSAPSLADYLSNVHPGDRPAILSAFGALRSGAADESVLQYRFIRDDGQVVWVEQHTFVERDEQGGASRLYGLSRDVTRARQTEQALHELNVTLEARVQERTRELEAEQAALDAFVAFSETAGSQIEPLALAQHAVDVLRDTLGDVSVAFHQFEDGSWQARTLSSDLDPEEAGVLGTGLGADAQSQLRAVQTREAVFVPGWAGDQQGVAGSEGYGAVAVYPCMVVEQPKGLLVMGNQRSGGWTAREQSVFRAVGRSLTLALERSEAALRLRAQNAELDARTQALEGFADLTRDLSLEADPALLIARALETVMSLLPPGYGAYWELRDGRWQATVQVRDVGSPNLQAAIDAGLPAGQTPTLDRPHQTGQPYFQDVYVQGADTAPEVVSHVNAVATLPVVVSGEVRGIFNVPLFHARHWNTADRAVLETTVRSLGLALERAEQARLLAAQRDALDARTQELSAANEELEAFTYSASHDLRTPVRHVLGFTDLARRALEETPNPKVSHSLDVVRKAGERMNTLIDAMLMLSRTVQHHLRFGEIDLGALVWQAQRDVELEFGSHPVQWEIGPLPHLHGDADLLQQVMTNLLSNAVKYSQVRSRSEVSVWAEQRPGEWAVSVRDNGVGFDPSQAQKLFGVFQRLHSQREFEGTGVGLATVRRIVLKHGGRVSARSEPGAGATFTFTLPGPR